MTEQQASAGLIHELPAIEVAVDQLDWAIRLLIEHAAYVPAYTLAGAAEELIGKHLLASSLTELRASFPDMDHNALRNFLKHGTANGEPRATIDVPNLSDEVALMIARAIINLHRYDGSCSSQTSRFTVWLHGQRIEPVSDVS